MLQLERGYAMFWEEENAIESIEELAAAHRRNGNISQAKSLYTCLIAMIKKKQGASCDALALNFFQLGEIYDDEGKHDDARIYYKRASDIWQTIHPDSNNNPFSGTERL